LYKICTELTYFGKTEFVGVVSRSIQRSKYLHRFIVAWLRLQHFLKTLHRLPIAHIIQAITARSWVQVAGCGLSRSNRGPGPGLTQPSILSGPVNEYRQWSGRYKGRYVRRCSVRAMYLSASAVAGKPNRGAITSVQPLPLPLPHHHHHTGGFTIIPGSPEIGRSSYLKKLWVAFNKTLLLSSNSWRNGRTTLPP